ncbi:serine ase inhibitor ia-2 [Trichoderma arundinaceum]|uniref:Serine ase inhibitor ia-2 n=1 Tax=Trichoderma arundinaceum TaxID=490622 RepID=A0A395N7M0_TRIAR|nr:serine ase inhibitor ia-2 [Trichoderma arundinaceum]
MRCSLWFITALSLFQIGSAVDQKKSAIIWFDNAATPDSVVNQVKDNIVNAGGKITHIYTIIKGFAVIAPEKTLASVQAWGVDHSIRVEEDEIVSSL